MYFQTIRLPLSVRAAGFIVCQEWKRVSDFDLSRHRHDGCFLGLWGVAYGWESPVRFFDVWLSTSFFNGEYYCELHIRRKFKQLSPHLQHRAPN